jgi:hypothetical protein
MGVLKSLLAFGLMFLAIVPVLVRGGQLIASFMAGRDIPKYVALTLLALLALLLAAGVAAALSSQGQQLMAAAVLAALPWAAHKASDWFTERHGASSGAPKDEAS